MLDNEDMLSLTTGHYKASRKKYLHKKANINLERRTNHKGQWISIKTFLVENIPFDNNTTYYGHVFAK